MNFVLETKRLLIRPYKDSDLEPLFAYRNDPEVAKYQGWDIPYLRERAVNWITGPDVIVPTEPGGRFSAALECKSIGEMIGDVGFTLTEQDVRQAHLGYTLARAYWHQGYATEAIQRLLAYLFAELNIYRIVAETDVLNEPSWRLLERLGFRREAHLVEAVWFRGAYESEYHYAILKREWEARKASEYRRQLTKKKQPKLTLDRPATYQIKVPGQISESWSDWAGGMTITVDSEADDRPITSLTGTLDQAALLGLLRRLYSLGVPLISVNCVED